MSSSSTPAVNETDLYGRIPTTLIAVPFHTIAASASSFATSTDFAAGPAGALNKCVETLVALGIWKTS